MKKMILLATVAFALVACDSSKTTESAGKLADSAKELASNAVSEASTAVKETASEAMDSAKAKASEVATDAVDATKSAAKKTEIEIRDQNDRPLAFLLKKLSIENTPYLQVFRLNTPKIKYIYYIYFATTHINKTD